MQGGRLIGATCGIIEKKNMGGRLLGYGRLIGIIWNMYICYQMLLFKPYLIFWSKVDQVQGYPITMRIGVDELESNYCNNRMRMCSICQGCQSLGNDKML